jgi:ABC-type amino acid transport substrate-binding protein
LSRIYGFLDDRRSGDVVSYSIKLSDITFEPQEYAFILPNGSPLRKVLSVAILDAIQSEEWTEMRVRYLGPASLNSP